MDNQLTDLNKVCDVRDLLKHLNLSVSIIMDTKATVWAVEVRASAVVEGASYSVLRQTPWFSEKKTFTDEEWEDQMDSLASGIAVAMGVRVFIR